MIPFDWLVCIGVFERRFGAAVGETERKGSAQSGFHYPSSYTGLQSTVNSYKHTFIFIHCA